MAETALKTVSETRSVGTASGGRQLSRDYIKPLEYNPKLSGRRGIKIFNEMRTHPRVKSVLNALKLPIKSAPWSVECDDQVVKEFIENQFGLESESEDATPTMKRKSKWQQLLNEVLLFYDFGFSLFEIEYKYNKDTGYIDLNSLGLRPQATIEGFKVDGEELVSIAQITNTKTIDIPANSALLFVHEQEGMNYWGTSVIRACYEPYFSLREVARFDLMAHQRFALGVVEAKLADPSITLTDDDIDEAIDICRSLQSGAMSFIVHEGKFTFKILEREGSTRPTDIGGTRSNAQLDILMSVLLAFMEIGSKGIGSYAASGTFSDMFYDSLRYGADLVTDNINCDVVTPLVDYNFGNVPCRLVCGELKPLVAGFIAEVLAKLTPFVTPERNLEQNIRKASKLPALPDDIEGVYEKEDNDEGSQPSQGGSE